MMIYRCWHIAIALNGLSVIGNGIGLGYWSFVAPSPAAALSVTGLLLNAACLAYLYWRRPSRLGKIER